MLLDPSKLQEEGQCVDALRPVSESKGIGLLSGLCCPHEQCDAHARGVRGKPQAASALREGEEPQGMQGAWMQFIFFSQSMLSLLFLMLSAEQNWLRIDEEYLKGIACNRRVVAAKAGSLVIWDSRTFHQNQYGTQPEERIVQYVSYLPKSGRTPAMKKKRAKYLRERRTTSHWAYPVCVNGKQPRTYGDESLKIDYAALKPPELSDMQDAIAELV